MKWKEFENENNKRYNATPSNFLQHDAILCQSMEHYAVGGDSIQHHAMLCDLM